MKPGMAENAVNRPSVGVNFIHTAPSPSQNRELSPARNPGARNSGGVHHVQNSVSAVWNWKAAALSAVLRALVFLVINWRAGTRAALAALAVEFAYRVATSGFYGSLIQRLRHVQPAWKAMLYVALLLPTVNQGLDAWLHWLSGTPHLAASVIASSLITVWAALFNLYAMRQGALVTGAEARPFLEDLRQLPALVAGFVLLVPRLVSKGVSR